MSTVEPIRNKNDIRKIEKFLSLQDKRVLLIFLIGINCGLRISDILGLNVSDVKDKSHIFISEKKTKKSKKIPINDKLKPIIKIFTYNRNEDEALFLTVFKNRMDRTYVYKTLKKVSQHLELKEKIGTHTLRKTFGYHHYKKNKDIAILQKIFNHSSSVVTLRYIGIEQEQIDQSYMNFIL